MIAFGLKRLFRRAEIPALHCAIELPMWKTVSIQSSAIQVAQLACRLRNYNDQS